MGGGKRRWESVSEATQFSLVCQNRQRVSMAFKLFFILVILIHVTY